jgi:hypothetical protein
MRDSGQHIRVQNTLWIQGPIEKSLKLGRERDIRWSWIKFQEELDGGEEPPFFPTPMKINVVDAADLVTTRVHAVGRLVRCK